MTIYFDSVIAIYLLDHIGSFQARAKSRLATLEAAGDLIAVSDLGRLECRVKPIRLGDAVSLAKFDAFFARPDIHKTPLTTAVFDRATILRAIHNIWRPPSMPAATVSLRTTTA
jgi:hypothetical protein